MWKCFYIFFPRIRIRKQIYRETEIKIKCWHERDGIFTRVCIVFQAIRSIIANECRNKQNKHIMYWRENEKKNIEYKYIKYIQIKRDFISIQFDEKKIQISLVFKWRMK